MTMLNVHVVGDGAFAFIGDRHLKTIEWTDIALLHEGTSGGKHSVAILLFDEKGHPFFAETTWALFETAYAAMRARVEMDKED